MTSYNKRALEFAKGDVVFARILVAPDPVKALKRLEHQMWLQTTEYLLTSAWVIPALDAREGVNKTPFEYSDDPLEIEEIERIQNLVRKFKEYSDLLAGTSDRPFTDYLNGITVEDFRCLMTGKRGMDAAREIQLLYKKGALAPDLGGSQLHRYMEQLDLPYIPTVNHLNAARRCEITNGRYNMAKSRAKEEKLYNSRGEFNDTSHSKTAK